MSETTKYFAVEVTDDEGDTSCHLFQTTDDLAAYVRDFPRFAFLKVAAAEASQLAYLRIDECFE